MTTQVQDEAICARLEWITPETASGYLERNQRNRVISQPRVLWLAEMIRRGEWLITHQGIAFDRQGDLIDGQHRLWAIIEADRPVQMLVTRGLTADAQDVVDATRPRRASDALAIAGEKNTAALAAAVRLLLAYENNLITPRNVAHLSVSATRTKAVLAQHQGLREYAGFGGAVHPRGLVPASIACWLGYEFASIDPDLAARYWSGVGDGLEITQGDPRNAVRSRLLNLRAAGRPLAGTVAAFLVRGWNAHRAGEKLTTTYFKPDSDFPQIAGRTFKPTA